jgi:DNA-binding response OmpR family regulator
MKNIFIIEETKFIYKALEQTFKQEGINCYVHHRAADFQYFLDDQKPDILFVSQSTVATCFSQFQSELQTCSHSPLVIAYGPKDGREQFDGIAYHYFISPLDMGQLFSDLCQLMTQQ